MNLTLGSVSGFLPTIVVRVLVSRAAPLAPADALFLFTERSRLLRRQRSALHRPALRCFSRSQ